MVHVSVDRQNKNEVHFYKRCYNNILSKFLLIFGVIAIVHIIEAIILMQNMITNNKNDKVVAHYREFNFQIYFIEKKLNKLILGDRVSENNTDMKVLMLLLHISCIPSPFDDNNLIP